MQRPDHPIPISTLKVRQRPLPLRKELEEEESHPRLHEKVAE